MPKIAPFLWFEKEAEEAATLYVSLLPDSHIDDVSTLPSDTPSGPADTVKVVEFTLIGRPYVAMAAGPLDPFNRAISFVVYCDDQAEIDRIWDGFLKGGGKEAMCGWLVDRWGLYWQIVPRVMPDMMKSPNRAAAKRAMDAILKMIKFDIAAFKRAFDGP